MTARLAVLDGVRTPFVREGGAFADLDALDLGKRCTAELLARNGLDARRVDQVVFGRVIASMREHDIAREIVLGTGMPPAIDAYSVSQACVSGYRSAVEGARAILAGEARCVVAGGADSVSSTPVALGDGLARALVRERRASGLLEHVTALRGVGLADLRPRPPKPEELSTGLTMGESAEEMARRNGVTRAEQDDFAHRSHVRAAAAWTEGRFDDQVMAVYRPGGEREVVRRDGTVRFDSERGRYDELEPAFDAEYGTITPGNASPLTDGAAALLLADEETAGELGIEPLGHLTHWSFTGVDPHDQLLIGPARVIPELLERTGRSLSDFDLVDLHEAFAAQVLSVLRALEGPVGAVDPERLNVDGGSIALGHPFAATGARQITQTLHALRRRGGGRALCSACAAGGLAAGVVLETDGADP